MKNYALIDNVKFYLCNKIKLNIFHVIKKLNPFGKMHCLICKIFNYFVSCKGYKTGTESISGGSCVTLFLQDFSHLIIFLKW